MIRIAGVNLPSGKHAWVALTAIYGVGRTRSYKILETVGIDPTTNIDTISQVQQDAIRDALKQYIVEGDLRREVVGNVKLLQEINCNRGIRHRKRLPTRGQRTKTNARTRKGKATAIANKKK